jgi:uncharacterized protein YndB with AHSA1/START domain
MTLSHRLDRSVTIQARPQTVFTFFTDSERWASWWGAGSTIDARAGGRMYIRHPGGVEASGQVLEVVSPERIVFTYGFESGKPIAPGASRVTIHLEPAGFGTRLHLVHEFPEPAVRDEHIQGWRFQLSLFANVVADLVNANAAATVDAWFAAWAEPDAAARERELRRIASIDIRFRDRYSLLEGFADILPHIEAAQRFMPDIQLTRKGDVRHCQGTVLAEWTMAGRDGTARGHGTNVFTLRPDGLIDSVVGFWS